MADIRSVLFVQEPQVMERHRELVETILVRQLGCEVGFASSAEDVTPDSRYDAVIAPTVSWLPDLLMRVEGLKWIHFLSAGVETIWSMDVDWNRYTLTSSKGVHAVPISEYVLGAMLHFAKHFDQFTRQSVQGVWRREWLPELTDTHVVVVGAGHIGVEVAKRSRLLGMRVTLVARTPRTDPEVGQILSVTNLQDAVRDADYLVVVAPLTPQTVGLVSRDIFESMRPGGVIVDVSRGGVVSEQGIVAALDSGHLRGAALDVFETEPLRADSPLWGRDNVLITPHVSGTTPKYMERALDVFLESVRLRENGLPLATEVKVSRGY